MTYDSRPDVYEHKNKVQHNIVAAVMNLLDRSATHDISKLVEPERSMYDTFVPKLEQAEYGTDEYRALLVEMGPALQHHYKVNRHHPEHWDTGINDMSLLDLVEMLCDWEAAGSRRDVGPLASLAYNIDRFGIDSQLAGILRNTIQELYVGPAPASRFESSH